MMQAIFKIKKEMDSQHDDYIIGLRFKKHEAQKWLRKTHSCLNSKY